VITTVLIMAQGEQRRLPKEKIGCAKQMLPVADEPIIVRAARLVREMAPWARVLTVGRWSDFSAVEGVAPVVELHDPGACVLDGVAAALARLDADERPVIGRAVVLLGDVVWSRQALKVLLHDESAAVFAGTPKLTPSTGEVFGCAFADVDVLRVSLADVPCRFKASARRSGREVPMTYAPGQIGGHLRNLLFYLQWGRSCRPPHPGTPRPWWEERYYAPIGDWTTDVDDEKDVACLPGLSAMVRADDAAEEAP
jgi:hypothetical protein